MLHEHVRYRGFVLPPARFRWGGPHMADDDRYLRSAREIASKVKDHCGLTERSTVLDVGCGQGRLLTGLRADLGGVGEYLGMDVHRPSIEWAQRHLARPQRHVGFSWIDVSNARYNAAGQRRAEDISLPNPSTSPSGWDAVALLSVFTHMRLPEMRVYLTGVGRVLAPSGRAVLTAFAEDGVTDEEENPADYVRQWAGPLHCIRVNRATFELLIDAAGLEVIEFHHHDAGAQSTYVVGRTR